MKVLGFITGFALVFIFSVFMSGYTVMHAYNDLLCKIYDLQPLGWWAAYAISACIAIAKGWDASVIYKDQERDEKKERITNLAKLIGFYGFGNLLIWIVAGQLGVTS